MIDLHKNIAQVLQLALEEVTQIEPDAYLKTVFIQCDSEVTIQRILSQTKGQVVFEFNSIRYTLPITKVH